jgi:hypothetical protein
MCSLTGGAEAVAAVPSRAPLNRQNHKNANRRKPVQPVHPSSTGVPLPPSPDDAEACARTVFFARVPPEILVEEVLTVFLRAGPVTGITLFRPWATSNNSKVSRWVTAATIFFTPITDQHLPPMAMHAALSYKLQADLSRSSVVAVVCTRQYLPAAKASLHLLPTTPHPCWPLTVQCIACVLSQL